jgi:RNA polymerase sigma factor (TIGR02999 family)
MTSTVTQLLAEAARGERGALDAVVASLYPELRAIARSRLAVQGHVAHLDTTSLVHESYMRLVNAKHLSLADRKHFFTYAAKVMRNIVIDFAREQGAQRRGSNAPHLQLDTAMGESLGNREDRTLLRLHDALVQLETLDPQLARVVEMRYFAGYSEDEVAELLDSSERTVRRQWQKARAFLLTCMSE